LTIRSWKLVVEKEIYVVVQLLMIMGIIQKPFTRPYFSKKSIVSIPDFTDVMNRDIFELICRFLHFVCNDSKLMYQGSKKIFKIYPILCHLNEKIQTLYLPDQNIRVDQSMRLWKGHLSCRQYLPLNASKIDITSFEICELNTGYLWCFLVYKGKGMKF
jgi:hypothetical protein